MANEGLTTRVIRDAFEEEIGNLGGTVAGVFDDGTRLLARSTLARTRHVGARDAVQGGVAVRSSADELCVRPYVFRQVCSNGMIMAHALEAWRIEQVRVRDPDACLFELREAVRACARDEVFADAAGQMRSARVAHAELALRLLAGVRRWPGSLGLNAQIMDRFERGRDHSRFGLLNAVTSVARDTTDPQRRWDLEALGGAMAALEDRVRTPTREVPRDMVRV
jgi:hypothetical protein